MSTNNGFKNGENCRDVMASGHDDMYTVNKLKNSCDCQIVCNECKTCIHCFSCTCIVQLNGIFVNISIWFAYLKYHKI